MNEVSYRFTDKRIQGPVRVTKIVYGCNLSFTMVHRYLDHFIENGLLRCVGERPSYKATDRGLEYLEAVRHAQQLLDRGGAGPET